MMIPFADCINHHNVDSSYELIHSDWPPLSLKEREAKFSHIWKSKSEKKESRATSRLAKALMSLTTPEESKTQKVIEFFSSKEGPEEYHTALKA